MIPNFSAGVDVDTRKAMGVFGSSPGNRSAALNNKVSVQVGERNGDPQNGQRVADDHLTFKGEQQD
jgi:hypothetical protein